MSKIIVSVPPQTWMSSSLEQNSDTSTFSPSETLVSETHSRPEARTWASEDRSRFRPDFNTLTRLKEGWRGPRFLFLASFATSITSLQHLPRNEGEKKKSSGDLTQWPAMTHASLYKYQPLRSLSRERKAKQRPLLTLLTVRFKTVAHIIFSFRHVLNIYQWKPLSAERLSTLYFQPDSHSPQLCYI